MLNSIAEEPTAENYEAMHEDSDLKKTQVKVVYEIKIVCAYDLDLPDG